METISGILDNKGTPLEKQKFTWKEMAGKPISKLDDDAFTRVRIILMNGVETDALRLSHGIARFNKELRLPLAAGEHTVSLPGLAPVTVEVRNGRPTLVHLAVLPGKTYSRVYPL